MTMKLDEAIKHLEETLSDKSHKWSCESCKQEHEQLLEWLKELKAYRELFESPEEAKRTLEQLMV